MLLAVMAFTANAQTKKYLGGDASLLPSYQEKGTVYKDFNGHKVKFLPFVKQQGWNMIRVRLFVDPQNAPEEHKGEGVCQDLNYVIGLCQQIKKTGMQVMLDFHYSDTWADGPILASSSRQNGGKAATSNSLLTVSMPTLALRYKR